MSSNSDENAGWGLSAEDLRTRLEEHYNPCVDEDGQWYRCQRDTENGTSCNRKAHFPTGVFAHENHHNIVAGDGSIVRPDPDNGEIMKDIYDEFDDL